MSASSKEQLIEEFGFTNLELSEIENFMDKQNQKSAKDILDILIKDKKLNNKQKIIISYVIGNSARESAINEDRKKGLIMDGPIPPIGG